MATKEKWTGIVPLRSGITQAGAEYGNNFPLVHASDVQVGDDENSRLDVKLQEISTRTGGVMFTPNVSKDGTLSWTSSDGLQDVPEEVNIKGEPGKDGRDGVRGPRGPKGSMFNEIPLVDGSAEVDVIGKYRIIAETSNTPRIIDTGEYSGANGISGVDATSVGTKIYLFGGTVSSARTNLIQTFDVGTKKLETLSTRLPSKMNGIAAAAVGTKIYLFGGHDGSAISKDIRVFDTVSEQFTNLTTFESALYNMGAVAVGTKIYLFGGNNNAKTIRTFDIKTNVLETLTITIPVDVNWLDCPGVAAVGTNIYLFSFDKKKMYMFDTTIYSFTELSVERVPFGYGSSETGVAHVAATINECVYLFSGQGSGDTSCFNNVYIFEPEYSAASISIIHTNGSYMVPVKAYAEHCNYFDFELAGYKLSDDSKTIYISYCLNDERKTITLTADSFNLDDCKITITGAERLLQYNSTIGSDEDDTEIDQFDQELSTDSTNAVQNKVVTKALDDINNTLDGKADKFVIKTINGESLLGEGNIDIEATGSGLTDEERETLTKLDNLIKTDGASNEFLAADGVYREFVTSEEGSIVIESELIDGSTKAVQNGVIKAALDNIKAALDNKVTAVVGKGLSEANYTQSEKTKLAGIAEGANKTTVNDTWDATSTNPVQNKVIAQELSKKQDNLVSGTTLKTINGQSLLGNGNITIDGGSGSNVTVDTALSTTSTNPVQNKVVKSELDKKVDKVTGKGLSTNDYTTAEKTKLSGIAEGANKTTVDTSLSSTSDNPISNKAVYTAINKLTPVTETWKFVLSDGTIISKNIVVK